MGYGSKSTKKFDSSNTIMHDSMDFESAIFLTGYGRFHYETLAACAISLLSVGFQCGLSAYIFPAAQCELGLSSSQLGLLNVAFLVGGTLSSFLWGVLADSLGRKPVLVLCHAANAAITIACALNRSVLALVACRCLNGFFVGGPGSIVFSYLGEFQPGRVRASVLCYSGLFFTASWLLLPLLACLVLPLPLHFDLGLFLTMRAWRLFLVLLALPELAAGAWFARLPESPKFFVAKGKPRQALMVLRRMYAGNTGRHPNQFPVKNLLTEHRIESRMVQNLQCRGRTLKALDRIRAQVRSLFRPPLLFVTGLTCTIMFTNMFGVFGLGLWFPELFVRLDRFQELHPNLTVSIQDLALLKTEKNATCAPSFDASVIQTTATMGVSSLAANALSGWFAGRFSLKTIPAVTMLLGGLSAGSIFWLRSPMQNLLVASIFQSAMVTANMTIGSVVVELFPTSVGAMAICLVMCSGRIGAIASNMLFGFLMDKHCEVAVFVVAGTVLLGAGMCLLIPAQNSAGDDGDERKFERKQIEIAVTRF